MEINRFEDVLGVIPQSEMVEGRMVCLTTSNANYSYDFGSRTDLVGAKLPSTAEEGKRAKYVITFAVDNRPTPILEPTPAYPWAMREGWDLASNVPFTAKVYMTHQANQEGLMLPSGVPALAFTNGTFTFASGTYMYDANIIQPGALVIAADTTTDTAANAGKLKYISADAVGRIGQVERFDNTTKKLTVRID